MNPKTDRNPSPCSRVFSKGKFTGKSKQFSHYPKHFGLSYNIELGPEPQEGEGCNTVVYEAAAMC